MTRAISALSLSLILLVAAGAAADELPPAEPAPAAAEQPAPSGYVADRIVAAVGGEVVTLWEVRRRMLENGDRMASVLAGGSGQEGDAARFQAALDDLIAERLVAAEAAKMGINISADDVEEHIAGIKSRNQWTDADLAAAVKMLGFGDLDAYRVQARKELMKSRVLRMKVESRISVSDTDVQEVFDARYEGGKTEEEIHLFHIAFVVSDQSTAADVDGLLAKAVEVRAMVGRSESFEELAIKYGQDSSAARGGDVGWFPTGVLQSSLENAAFALADGEVSNVVQSSFGFHILKVAERRRIPLRNPEEARQRVKWELSTRAFEQGYRDYIFELRKTTRIEILYVPPK